MEKLIGGLHDFQQNTFPKHRELFQKLASGQSPETLFITCSDSRIDPNLITGTKPGELFVIRNAGNLVPPYGRSAGGEAGTIEYAVKALGVKDIVVCGHSHCGAMTGLLAPPESLAAMPAVADWLRLAEPTRRVMTENYATLNGEQRLNACIQENVLMQVESLRTHPAVAARLAAGDLYLHAWVYKIETGEVFSYDPEAWQFLPPVSGTSAVRPKARRLAS